MVEKKTGNSIKILCSDQGGEYKLGDFNKYCKENGIVQQFTVPHTPQQNGVAESKNRTLVECARSMMKYKNLSNAFWAEAINTAVYLKNRSPTRCLDNVTPFQALYGSKPAVNNLKVFGCKAFAHIPKENRRKLDAKATKCIFIGYCSEFKAYKLFDPITHKVFASRDVLFHEQEAGNHDDNIHEEWQRLLDEGVKEEQQQQQQQPTQQQPSPQRQQPSPQRQQQQQEEGLNDMENSGSHSSPSSEDRSSQSGEEDNQLRRSSRQIRLPERYKDYALMSSISNVIEPMNFDEANEHDEWRNAMEDEYESIMKNNTWELTELPKHKKPVQYTPILKGGTSNYYVGVDGIVIDGKRLPISSSAWKMDMNSGNGGTIIDSGTSLTMFTKEAYDVIMKALGAAIAYPRATTQDPAQFELCFKTSGVKQLKLPILSIVFGGGKIFSPPSGNYVLEVEEGVGCVGFQPSPAGSPNIIGNLLQQNFFFQYDVQKSLLGFAPADCSVHN
jgi:hypothetical protein